MGRKPGSVEVFGGFSWRAGLRLLVEPRTFVVRLRRLALLYGVKIDSLQKIMLAIAQSRSVELVLQQVVAGVAECSNVALVRIWLIGKGDICAVCRFSVECPSRERCLHLAASAGHPRSPGVDISRLDGAFRRFPLGVRKIGQI